MTEDRAMPVPLAEQTFVEPSRAGDGLVRSFRVSIPAWEIAQQHAFRDKVNLSIALNRFLIGYGHHKIDLPELYDFPGENRPRKFRCTDTTWDRAVARAADEGFSMREVMNRFVTAYAHPAINLPELVLIYH